MPTSRTRRPQSVRSWRASAVALAAGLLLTACGVGSPGEQSAPGPAQPGFPRTVQHAMGETVLERQPQTVAALDSSYVDTALALDTKVVAMTKYPTPSGQLPDYLSPQEKALAADARVIGELSSPDPEQLYEARPDLIVSAKVRHEKFYNEFTGAAPTVFSQSTGATWKDNIRLLGRSLGKDQLAEQRIREYEQRAQRIGQSITAKLGRTPTMSQVRFVEGEPTVRLASTRSFSGSVLKDVGFTRPPGQPDPAEKVAANISQEQLSTVDADYIYVSSYADPSKEAADPRAQFEANPLWGKLAGKVVPVDDTTWFTSVSLQGAHRMLDDLARQFAVDPAR